MVMLTRQIRGGVIVAALLCIVSLMDGHAILLSAKPGIGQDLTGPDIPVNLQFNSRIDAKRSRLMLVLPNGGQQTLDIDQNSSPNSLISKAKALAPGSYILRWVVLAADGHISRGEVPFRIQ